MLVCYLMIMVTIMTSIMCILLHQQMAVLYTRISVGVVVYQFDYPIVRCVGVTALLNMLLLNGGGVHVRHRVFVVALLWLCMPVLYHMRVRFASAVTNKSRVRMFACV